MTDAFHRSVGVRFGAASPVTGVDLLQTILPDPFAGLNKSFGNEDDDGLRIRFSITRAASLEPDTCKLQLWNLSKAAHNAIAMDYQIRNASRKIVLESRLPSLLGVRATALNAVNALHKVALFAGYKNSTQPLFLGDYKSISAREQVSDTDYVTTLDLGDSFLLTRDAYIDSPVGPRQTASSLILDLVEQAGAVPSADSAIKIAKIVPGAKIQAFTGGAIGNAPATESLAALEDLFNASMFIREGQWYILGAGDVFDDFALAIIDGRDILDGPQPQDDGQVGFRVNLNGGLVPGRAVYTFDSLRVPTGTWRVETVVFEGDTHGNDWFSQIVCSPYVGPRLAFDPSALA